MHSTKWMPPPRMPPTLYGLWLVIIVWCHFMVGGARAEIQYISSAPSVLTPIRLLTISHDFARSLLLSRLIEGFCSVRAPQSSEKCKIQYSPDVEIPDKILCQVWRFYIRCDVSYKILSNSIEILKILEIRDTIYTETRTRLKAQLGHNHNFNSTTSSLKKLPSHPPLGI